MAGPRTPGARSRKGSRGRAEGSRRRESGAGADELAFLAEVGADLASSLEIGTVVQKIADRIRDYLDFHLFCVMLWNERTQLLEHSYVQCQGETLHLNGGFPLGRGISGSAAAARSAIRVGNVLEDPRYVRFRQRDVEIRSELAIPLFIGERLIGVLDLESTEPDGFREEHERLLTALGSHVAIALENARLHGKVLKEERRLEEDLATAREIQRGLLPVRVPRIPGLEIGFAHASARELAGDFYDFLPYGSGRLGFALGDVAGKATAAALYGSLAVGLLRGQTLERHRRPGDLLRHLNDLLHLPRVRNRYLALTFAVYDDLERSLTLSNAGVPWPYLVRDGRVERLQVGGMPLGLYHDMHYDELKVCVEPGDVFVFTSDGVGDAMDGEGMPFSEAGLAETILRCAADPAPAIAECVLAASQTYATHPSIHSDDRTLVVLKRNGG